MTMKRTIATGLSAAGLVLAGALALALGHYNLAVADAETSTGNAGRYDGPAASYRTIVTSDPRWQATPAEPLVVSIPHRLRKQDALRRVKTGLDSLRRDYGFLFKVQEEIWTGYHLQFRVSMLGQAGSGSIEVTDHLVRLELLLPWPLSKLAEAALPAIRREGALMLERK